MSNYPKYEPAPTKAHEESTGAAVSPNSLCTPEQAAMMTAILQPLFKSVLSYAVDPGPPGNVYIYPDLNPHDPSSDDRQVFAYFSEDGVVGGHWIGPLLVEMFKSGHPGQWVMKSRMSYSAKRPPKAMPPALAWESIPVPETEVPQIVTEVPVTIQQAQMLVA